MLIVAGNALDNVVSQFVEIIVKLSARAAIARAAQFECEVFRAGSLLAAGPFQTSGLECTRACGELESERKTLENKIRLSFLCFIAREFELPQNVSEFEDVIKSALNWNSV